MVEKRGQEQRAHGFFALSNTLRPTKAAAAKLAGDTKACPVEVEREGLRSTLVSSWMEAYKHLAEDGLVDPERPAKDEAEARAIVCTSESHGGRGRGDRDARPLLRAANPAARPVSASTSILPRSAP